MIDNYWISKLNFRVLQKPIWKMFPLRQFSIETFKCPMKLIEDIFSSLQTTVFFFIRSDAINQTSLDNFASPSHAYRLKGKYFLSKLAFVGFKFNQLFRLLHFYIENGILMVPSFLSARSTLNKIWPVWLFQTDPYGNICLVFLRPSHIKIIFQKMS